MPDRKNAGQEGCRTEVMPDRSDAGQELCQTGRMQDRRDAEQEGSRTGGMQRTGLLMGRMCARQVRCMCAGPERGRTRGRKDKREEDTCKRGRQELD